MKKQEEGLRRIDIANKALKESLLVIRNCETRNNSDYSAFFTIEKRKLYERYINVV